MIEQENLPQLSQAIRNGIESSGPILRKMRQEVRPLRSLTRRIHPRSARAISIVGTDGGDNRIRFDPFMLQLVRVVDSGSREYCLDVLAPAMTMDELTETHLSADGTPLTPLGGMLRFLNLERLDQLSTVLRNDPKTRKPSWVQVYREMTEWAVLLHLVRDTDFGSDTIIVRDGLLRSKMFAKGLFTRYREGIMDGIGQQYDRSRRRLYVAGVAKRSKVLQTYRLAMALEGILRTSYPCYAEVPTRLLNEVYKWSEYADDPDMVAGKMFFAKFGPERTDPVWAVDLLTSQAIEAATIFGYLLEDALEGFPTPYFPACLQRAHEHAALVDFDFTILQDRTCQALRDHLGDDRWTVDELELQEAEADGTPP